MPFSERNGYNATVPQLEDASPKLRRRIFQAFYNREFGQVFILDYRSGIETMMDKFGVLYDYPNDSKGQQKNADKLRKFVMESDEWYLIYDFMEIYLSFADAERVESITNEFNDILKEEKSAYRIVNKQVVPVTSQIEINSIEEASATKYETVNEHINKACALLSDRKKPDYENSIKESISAVESMCCIITGVDGKKATLKNAIAELDQKGVYIHKAMKEAFEKLYGYASDEDGVRHGGSNLPKTKFEDAEFMLTTCSAFVNYLIKKWDSLDKECNRSN